MEKTQAFGLVNLLKLQLFCCKVVKRGLLLNKIDDRDFMSIRVSRQSYIILNNLKRKITFDLQSNGYFYNIGFNDVLQQLFKDAGCDLSELKKENG